MRCLATRAFTCARKSCEGRHRRDRRRNHDDARPGRIAELAQACGAAGISKPLIYNYFGSKEGLLTACLRPVLPALALRDRLPCALHLKLESEHFPVPIRDAPIKRAESFRKSASFAASLCRCSVTLCLEHPPVALYVLRTLSPLSAPCIQSRRRPNSDPHGGTA